jgi:hypothetical protein
MNTTSVTPKFTKISAEIAYQHLLQGDVEAFATIFILSKRGPYHSLAATYLETGCDYHELDRFSFHNTLPLVAAALESLAATASGVSCIGSFELRLVAGDVVLAFIPEVRLVFAGAPTEMLAKVFPRESRAFPIEKHQIGEEVTEALTPASTALLMSSGYSSALPMVGCARLLHEKWRAKHEAESGILIFGREAGKSGLEFLPANQLVDLDEEIAKAQ